MNAKRAAKIRREVYGDLAVDPKYFRGNKTGAVIRDESRRVYQSAKRGWNRLTRPERQKWSRQTARFIRKVRRLETMASHVPGNDQG